MRPLGSPQVRCAALTAPVVILSESSGPRRKYRVRAAKRSTGFNVGNLLNVNLPLSDAFINCADLKSAAEHGGSVAIS